MSNIAVSFDQQRAVRLSDGARLVAVADAPGSVPCRGCEASMLHGGSCLAVDAESVQQCSRYSRKDKLNITWRRAE